MLINDVWLYLSKPSVLYLLFVKPVRLLALGLPLNRKISKTGLNSTPLDLT